jgi:hypothetical protein
MRGSLLVLCRWTFVGVKSIATVKPRPKNVTGNVPPNDKRDKAG